MQKIEDLRDLLLEQGRELYDASRQEERALPGIERQVVNPAVKQIIEQQIISSKDQRRRLESAFKQLNASLDGEPNACCESVLRRAQNLMGRTSAPEVRDAVIINSIQRLNHLKITGYGSLAAYANEIGEHDIAQTFHNAMEDEWEFDRHLNRVAEREVNLKAAHALVV